MGNCGLRPAGLPPWFLGGTQQTLPRALPWTCFGEVVQSAALGSGRSYYWPPPIRPVLQLGQLAGSRISRQEKREAPQQWPAGAFFVLVLIPPFFLLGGPPIFLIFVPPMRRRRFRGVTLLRGTLYTATKNENGRHH